MKIYIDFDDTITDSIQRVCHIVNKRYNRDVKYETIKEWDFSDAYTDIPIDDIVSVFGEEEFFKLLRAKEGAIVSIHRLAKRNEVYIVSKVDTKAMRRKDEWIKRNFNHLGIDVTFIGIPLYASKGIVDMSDGIMIDNCVRFLNETNAKYKIFFDNQTAFDKNQDWDGLRAHDWKEAYKIMADIIRKEKGITNGKI